MCVDRLCNPLLAVAESNNADAIMCQYRPQNKTGNLKPVDPLSSGDANTMTQACSMTCAFTRTLLCCLHTCYKRIFSNVKKRIAAFRASVQLPYN